MQEQTLVTRHARKRIERGDQYGLRTKLPVEKVVDLIQSEAALKVGRTVYVYSKPDDITLKVITAKQGKVIVTVFDTARESTPFGDMLGRARAGEDPLFAPDSLIDYSEAFACKLELGTCKEKKGRLDTNTLYEAGTVYGIDRHNVDTLTTRRLHEMVVAATDDAVATGAVSKTASKKLHSILHSNDGWFCVMPVWLSYELLQAKRPFQV